MRTRSQGFTLVEMLVALALVSLMSVAILQAYRFSQRALAQSTRVDAELRDVAGAQRLLRRLIEQAYPFEGSRSATGETSAALLGDRNRLDLSAPASAHAGGHGFYRYGLEHEESGELRVTWQLDRNGAAGAGAAGLAGNGQAELLLERVEKLDIAYLELVRHGDGRIEPHWQENWIDKTELPALVRVRVEFAAEDRRRWPELVVAPGVTTDANCVFDVVSRMCRISS